MQDIEIIKLVSDLKADQADVKARQEAADKKLDAVDAEIKEAKKGLYRAAWVIFVTLAAQVVSRFFGIEQLIDLFIRK